jgi:hypothetical protein
MTTRFRPGRKPQRAQIEANSDPDLMPDRRKAILGGVAVPRRFTSVFPVESAQIVVRATIRIARGAALVESLEIVGAHRPPTPRVTGESDIEATRRGLSERQAEGSTLPITAAGLRELADRLDVEVRECALQWAPIHTPDESGRTFVDTREEAKMRRALANRVVRRTATAQDLAEVAAVYRANPDLPRAAVAYHFGISDSKASRWIKAARADGHLKQAPGPGLSGEADD